MWERLWQWLVFVLSLAIAAVVISCGMLIFQSWRELEAMRHRERETAQRLAAVQAELAAKEAYLQALLHDPMVLERAVRERLGYVGPDETVFRFEPAPGAGAPTPPPRPPGG